MENNRIGDRVEAFRDSLRERGLSDLTISNYLGDVRSFILTTNSEGLTPDQLPSAVATWMNAGRKKWKPKTTHRKLTSLRSFANFLGLSNFLEGYKLPTPAKVEPRTLPDGVEDIKKMIAVCTNPIHVYEIVLAGLCGLRIKEVLQVRPSHFSMRDKTLTIRGKGDVERVIPVSDLAWEYLEPAIFEGQVSKKDDRLVPYADRNGRRVITELARRAGITERVASHKLRKTFGTEAYNKTGDIRAAQRLLGHANVTTTQGYVASSMEKMRAAANFGGEV